MLMIKKHTILGITLIELLVVVAIIAILASVGYPSYIDHVTRTNRTEENRELVRIATLMEQYFIDHRRYTDNMTKLGLSADPFISQSGNYSIDATVVNSTFILKATALGAHAIQDKSCPSLSITETLRKTALSATCWG
jgi:type IV pilus assembly protein PilE